MVVKGVSTVSVFVEDQARAKDWYMHQLGMELRADFPMGEDDSAGRWIAVAAPGSEVEIILYKPNEQWQHYEGVVGKSQALTIGVTDMEGTTSWLKARGVNFIQEPETQPWGTFAIIVDSEGNKLILVEQPPSGSESRRSLE